MAANAALVWDDALCTYQLSETHPLHPIRLALTIRLSQALGVTEGLTVVTPSRATDEQLIRIHDRQYVDAVRTASTEPYYAGFGLGTPDNPVFEGMHDAAALVAGASIQAAELVARGEVEHAANIAGGLHHAMRAQAWGFCVYNDAALAIDTALRAGIERIGYVDIDVHHGDGVQAAFENDPRVMTISLHQDPRTLFPGTGFPYETGESGTSVNVAVPPGTDDRGWLRAFHAVVPPLLHQFRPQLLVTQDGCDTYCEDPLASLALTIDGQRTAYAALHQLAHELCEGRWVALGGGGYSLVRCVPRTWTHLIAEVAGTAVDPATPLPTSWKEVAAEVSRVDVPESMSDGGDVSYQSWPEGDHEVDQAIQATKDALAPYYSVM